MTLITGGVMHEWLKDVRPCIKCKEIFFQDELYSVEDFPEKPEDEKYMCKACAKKLISDE